MGEIKKFGEKIQELGNTYSINVLTYYGEDIYRLAGNYDIINIDKRLQDFPVLVEEITKHRGGSNE